MPSLRQGNRGTLCTVVVGGNAGTRSPFLVTSLQQSASSKHRLGKQVDCVPLFCLGRCVFHSNLSRSLTLPENSLLGPDVGLQLGGSDVDADGLRQVADGLRHHGFGCVAGLQARRLQPNVFTLVSRDEMLFQTKV